MPLEIGCRQSHALQDELRDGRCGCKSVLTSCVLASCPLVILDVFVMDLRLAPSRWAWPIAQMADRYLS